MHAILSSTEKSTTMLEHGTNLYNPDLKWETTVTRNIGIDYGFWNNRISGAIDFYWNTTRDLLMRTEIPSLSDITISTRTSDRHPIKV